jgi:hypothetical protein
MKNANLPEPYLIRFSNSIFIMVAGGKDRFNLPLPQRLKI